MQQQYPEPTVGALIFNPKGEIFLMASSAWRGKYVVPGGHVELSETLENALRREIKEETGLDIFDIEFLTFSEFIYGKDFREQKHFIFFDYVCKTKDETIHLNEEGTGYVWASPSDALGLPVEPSTRSLIVQYMQQKKPLPRNKI